MSCFAQQVAALLEREKDDDQLLPVWQKNEATALLQGVPYDGTHGVRYLCKRYGIKTAPEKMTPETALQAVKDNLANKDWVRRCLERCKDQDSVEWQRCYNYVTAAEPPTALDVAPVRATAEAVADGSQVEDAYDVECRLSSKFKRSGKKCSFCGVNAQCMVIGCTKTPLQQWCPLVSVGNKQISLGESTATFRCSPGLHCCNAHGLQLNTCRKTERTAGVFALKDGRVVRNIYRGRKRPLPTSKLGLLERRDSDNAAQYRKRAKTTQALAVVKELIVAEKVGQLTADAALKHLFDLF